MIQKDLEQSFKAYLSNTKKLSSVTIKNYLSDFRNFYSWLKLNSKLGTQSPTLIAKQITHQNITDYKNYLLSKKSAKSTTKRRLATIRIFCQFCLNQHLITYDPSREIKNPTKSPQKEINDTLSQFGLFLKSQKMSKNTIKNYVNDVRQFLKANEIQTNTR